MRREGQHRVQRAGPAPNGSSNGDRVRVLDADGRLEVGQAFDQVGLCVGLRLEQRDGRRAALLVLGGEDLGAPQL
jgi:hypothetical protein